MTDGLDGWAPLLRMALALSAGGVIGLERTFHGRAAGFRTYALVCLAAAMAMLIAVYPQPWAGQNMSAPGDVTRVVQGVLTGIGFLGAGVIVKHGASVHGLTTAASIWTTAVIGILMGGGYYWQASAGVLLVLGALSVFRRIEDRLDKQCYAQVRLGVSRAAWAARHDIDALLLNSGLCIEGVAYGLKKQGAELNYEYTVSARSAASFAVLAEELSRQSGVLSFQISPSLD